MSVTVTNDEMCRQVLGANVHPLTEVIVPYRLRLLGHLLRMPTHRPLFRVYFARIGRGWMKRRAGKFIT